MPAVNPCPHRDDYERLIHGELSPADVERLSQHLAGCSSCAAAMPTLLGEDTLLSVLRGAPVDVQAGNEVPADLTQRLLALAAQPQAGTAELSSLLAPPQGSDEIGRLAHYRVLKVLGEGGMGVVFLAEDQRLGRTVALKTMKPDMAADPRHRQRFLREARAAAKVEDDHIVPIYDVGEDRGVPWLAMPFLKGQSLDDLLKRVKVLKPAQAVRLGAQVARGLAAAHAAGLIHRDIKPGNIWVEPEGGGRARLLDFGLARDQSPQRERGDDHLTRTGAVMGTPAFMAPEQARGEPLDGRADLFSLGCVLYRAVTGRLPFKGEGMMGTLLALATETPPAPDAVNPDVPSSLSALIMSLLAKDRSARPASASAVATALHAVQETATVTVPTAKPVALPVASRTGENPWADLTEVAEQPAPAVPPRRRWRRAAAAALLLALGGALAAGIVVIIKDKDGKEVARVTLPDGGLAVIQQDGDRSKRKGDPVNSDPDRRAVEWVLSIGGTVTIRLDGQEQDVKVVKGLPAAPFELAAVKFYDNQKVDDAGLEHLKGLTNLMWLSLYYTRVSDAGLEHLKGLTSLTGLNLYGTRVSDSGLVHLKGLTNLTSLELAWVPVGDAGLEHLKGLTNLMHLRLDGTQVSDTGLVHLRGLTKLTRLYLIGTRVSEAGLISLGDLPLEIVEVDWARVSASGFARLRTACPRAKVTGEPRPSAVEDLLAVGATLVIRSSERQEDRQVKTIADLPRERFLVRRADCTGVKKRLTDVLASLCRQREYEFDRLEALDLSGCAIDGLSFSTPQTIYPHLWFAPAWEGLQQLNVSGTKIADDALLALEGLPNLRKLDLAQTGVTGRGLGHLAKLPKLADLSLAGSKLSELFAAEVGALTKLERLSLASCTFSDAGLKHLAGLSHLTQLDLTGTQVTADGVARLQKALPKCKIVWDGNAKK